jgi:L-alanine-DL-glutamate epimerase-like enolase superfamily enzyme
MPRPDDMPRDDVRIRNVEAIPLRIPFRSPFKMAAPGASREHVDVLVVRLDAGDGLEGLGETQAWRRQGSGEEIGGLTSLVREVYLPLLLGRSPLEINAVMRDLENAAAGRLYAQAAVGDALYDLAARSLGVSLCTMLGGSVRERVPVGIALGIRGSPAAIADDAAEATDEGYRHIRLKIGLEPEADLANVEAARKRLREDVILRADANGGLAFPAALRLLVRLAPFGLEFVEQPVAGHDLEGMAALARAVPVPLSADESLHDEHGLIDLARRRAAAIIQTKSGKNGGIHRIRRLWQIADAAGIGIFPGNHPATSLNVGAVAHLAASWPGELLVGDFQSGLASMLEADIVTTPLRPRDGQLQLPEGPGLGLALDPDAIARYRLDR